MKRKLSNWCFGVYKKNWKWPFRELATVPVDGEWPRYLGDYPKDIIFMGAYVYRNHAWSFLYLDFFFFEIRIGKRT